MQSEGQKQAHITWRQEPPTPAQLAAWDRLWAWLLAPVDAGPETAQPQNHVGPRAATVATVCGGHNFLSEPDNDNTDHIPRT